ncbi:hypothetical protein CR513_02434, partial [Mucuna pruriens]
MLKGSWRKSFERKYGRILELMDIELGSLSTLIQIYNPPMRCFTSQDFQLASTLKEYECIMGKPLIEDPPYLYQGHYPSWNMVAKLLKVPKPKLMKRKLSRNNIDGLSQNYLEERMKHFSNIEDWIASMDVLQLVAYRPLTSLCLSRQGQEPSCDCPCRFVLHDKPLLQEERGKIIYRWLTAHMFTNKCRNLCPIEDLKWSFVKTMTNKEWAQYLRNSSDKSVCWYLKRNERETLSTNMRASPMYPLTHPPMEESMAPFVIHGLSPQNVGMLRRIRQAWGKILKNGQELGPRSHGSSSYKSWLKLRVQCDKLPLMMCPWLPRRCQFPVSQVMKTWKSSKKLC